MSDGDPPCGELPSEFESALKKLKGLFAGALPSLEAWSVSPGLWSALSLRKSGVSDVT